MWRWVAGVSLSILVLSGSLCAQDDEYKNRRAALVEGDHQGLFELGMWCLGRGAVLEKRARGCFEDLLHVSGPVRDRAAYRLALWHLKRGRGYADQKLGVELLHSLAARGAEVPAARDLEGLKMTAGAKKREMVERARRSLVGGHILGAARALAEARRLPFGRTTGEPDLGSPALFESIARALADSEREAKRFTDKNLPIACPKCSGTGLEPCKTCKGKGTIRKKTAAKRVLTEDGFKYKPGKWVTVKCGKCQGTGKAACASCRATGIDFGLFDEATRRVFLRFGTWLKNLSAYKEPRKAVVRAFEETVNTRLRVPASLKAGISFPLIPPTREKMDMASLKTFWETAAEKGKYDLIRGITILSARWLEPFFFHSESRRTLGVKEPFREMGFTVPLSPEIVGAEPHIFQNRWIKIVGEIESIRGKGLWTDDIVWLDVKGREGPHNLRFFLWRESSREKHRILSDLHKDFNYLKRFLWTYPFAIEKEVSRVRPGDIVILYGRMISRPGGYPSQGLEVWAFETAADRRGVRPPKDPAPDPRTGATKAEKAALFFGKAVEALRSPGTDEGAREGAKGRALEALREAVDLYQMAMSENPDDLIVQESHAQTLHVLHTLLAGAWWPSRPK